MTVRSTRIALIYPAADAVLACTATRLAADGYHVIACQLPGCAPESLPPDSASIRLTSVDVTKPDETGTLVKTCADEFGGVDALILGGSLSTGADALRAWTDCVDGFLPQLERNAGRVVSVLSSAGKYRSGYFRPAGETSSRQNEAMVNGAILGMTRQRALESGRTGVRFNAVVTGLLEDAPEVEAMSDRERRFLIEEIPLRRFGRPEEIAAAIAFLASPAANYLTGDSLDVNGGWWLS